MTSVDKYERIFGRLSDSAAENSALSDSGPSLQAGGRFLALGWSVTCAAGLHASGGRRTVWFVLVVLIAFFYELTSYDAFRECDAIKSSIEQMCGRETIHDVAQRS